MVKKKIIGCRVTRLNAKSLEGNYIKGRKRKPYKTRIIMKGNKHCVEVQDKKY